MLFRYIEIFLNKMKRILALSVLLLLFSTSSLFAQTFSFTKNSPPFVTSNDTSYFAEIVDTGYVNNLTGSSFEIKLKRTAVNLPSGWETAICDINTCYPPNIDSAIASYPPGMSEVTFHFYPYGIIGQGTMTIVASRVSNPSENYTLIFGARLEPVGIKQISNLVEGFRLDQNYPNPFNPVTKIEFAIPKSDYVDLRVYDLLGREVKVLLSQHLNIGEYEVEFDAKSFASGMYYYRLQSGENVSVKKMTLVK